MSIAVFGHGLLPWGVDPTAGPPGEAAVPVVESDDPVVDLWPRSS